MLVGLGRAPTLLNPRRNPEAARNRADLVLENMARTGAIAREQADAAHRQPASVAMPPVAPRETGYFLDAASAEANLIRPGATAADLGVATMFDPDIQALAEAVVGEYLAKEGKPKGVSQAALVAMAPDGAILAMVGGRDYAESQFNRATQAQRQPGLCSSSSSIRPHWRGASRRRRRSSTVRSRSAIGARKISRAAISAQFRCAPPLRTQSTASPRNSARLSELKR